MLFHKDSFEQQKKTNKTFYLLSLSISSKQNVMMNSAKVGVIATA